MALPEVSIQYGLFCPGTNQTRPHRSQEIASVLSIKFDKEGRIAALHAVCPICGETVAVERGETLGQLPEMTVFFN